MRLIPPTPQIFLSANGNGSENTAASVFANGQMTPVTENAVELSDAPQESAKNDTKRSSIPNTNNSTFFGLLFPEATETVKNVGTQGTNVRASASSISLASHLSNYAMSHHGGHSSGAMFYRNAVTRDKQGHLFLDRDPVVFSHILAYLRTGNVFIKSDNRDRAAFIVVLQQLHAEAEFFLLDHLVGVIEIMLETERDVYDKEEFSGSSGGQTEDWMEYRVMTVSDVANSTFLSLLNSGKGWKIERIFTETKVVFKCPTCVHHYAGGSSATCTCAIKHEKSAWVSEQVNRALLARKKGAVMISAASNALLRK